MRILLPNEGPVILAKHLKRDLWNLAVINNFPINGDLTGD